MAHNKMAKDKIPMLPILDWQDLLPGKNTGHKIITDLGSFSYYRSGRSAITAALDELRFESDEEIMLPAFHCPSMVEPSKELGIKCVFYKILEDLSPDIDDVKIKINTKTKAIMLVNYFSILNDFMEISQICKKHGTSLIEDCSHIYYVNIQDTKIGKYSDYIIASQRKYFPLYDGGSLISITEKNIPIKQKGLSVRYNIKCLYNMIAESALYGRLWPLNIIVMVKKKVSAMVSYSSSRPQEILSDENSTTKGFAYEDERFSQQSRTFSMSLCSKIFLAIVHRKQKNIEKRVRNFNYYYGQFKDCGHAKPICSIEKISVAPYVFPLYIPNPDKLHKKLLENDMPVWRWEVLESDICEVSNRFGRAIFQLPCHQGLNKMDIFRIINFIKANLA